MGVMDVSWSRISLKLAGRFDTAVAQRQDKETLWVRISHRGIEGWGEAVPMDTYGQTLASAESALAATGPLLLGDDPMNVEEIVAMLVTEFDDQRATVAAVDAAIHDWIGKRLNVPTCRWLGLDSAGLPLTSYTLGIDEPDAIAERVRAAASYPIFKVKVGTPRDEEILSLIRTLAPDKTIRVDANTAWSVDEALDRMRSLSRYDIEFVEQPIPPGDNDGLRRLKEAGICPVVADESCVRPEDVMALAGCVDGINIKLSKCGGIRQALEMVHLARRFGMKVMLGCMIESSLGIATAAQLASLADWLDLDGHLLLSADPFTGIGGECGRLRVGGGPGLGARPNHAIPS